MCNKAVVIFCTYISSSDLIRLAIVEQATVFRRSGHPTCLSLSFSYMPLIPPFLLSVTLCLIVLSGCILVYYSFFVPRYVLPTVRSRIFFVSTRHIYQGYCLFLPFLFLIFLFLPSPLIEWPFWDTSVRRLRLFHCARTLARVFCIKQQDHTQRIYIHKNSRSTSVYL